MIEWQLKSFEQLSNLEIFHIYKTRTAVFVVEQQCAYQEVDDKDLQALHLFTANHAGISAYCRILTGEMMYIGRVLVAENARGVGLAKELMKQAVNYCLSKQTGKPIRLQAQAYLQDFYHSFGFEPVSEIYLEDGIPHLDMELQTVGLAVEI